jgi:predicted amidohydrolase YtcJ
MIPPVPDLLVVAPIVTLDPARPRAAAALVRGGRFVRVGGRAECEGAAGGDALRVEAGGAVPGLADAHGHVALLGRWRREVQLRDARSEEECVERVAAAAASVEDGWLRGAGWDQHRWPGARLPSEGPLSRAVPRRPVALARVDGHALWVNAAGLAAAGIDARTPDPPGGRILRDASGRPTGVLIDAAQDRVLAAIPVPGPGEREDDLRRGLAAVAAAGLTTVHDAGVGPEVLASYRRLEAEGALPVRVVAMLDGGVPAVALRAALDEARAAPGRGLLEVPAAKLFADGALGSRGAALEEDYADAPGERGLLVLEPAELAARVAAIVAAGLQPAIHAIGDRAIRAALEALEAAGPAVPSLRPRLEHLELLRSAHLPRLVRLGAVASVQPAQLASDGPWLPARLGAGTERLRGAFAFRTLARAGVVLAFGSDFPVEDPDPRAGLAAAEARAGPGGTPLGPEEALGREEALAAFTRGAAWASFAEARRGVVREGMEADLTLLDADPLALGVDALRRVGVAGTVVGGRLRAAAARADLTPRGS